MTVFERLANKQTAAGGRLTTWKGVLGGQLQAKQRYQVLSAPAIDARWPQVAVTWSGVQGRAPGRSATTATG